MARGPGRVWAQRVREIAAGAPFTSTPAGWLAGLYSLPTHVEGIRVLDVAAGCSDFAHWLGERGARAVALDFNYRGNAAIGERWRAWMERAAAERGTPPAETARAIGEAIERFEELRASGRAAYVCGSADVLPFRDGTFDVVASFSGIFGALDEDPALLALAVGEAIRVTKRRGLVQLAPALEGAWLSHGEVRTQRALIDRLRRDRSLKVTLARHHDPATGEFGKLTIEKRG